MENSISALFNRAILDTIIGLLTFILVAMVVDLAHPVSVIELIPDDFRAPELAAVTIVMAYLIGNFVDKLGFLAIERVLFSKKLQSRDSGIPIPTWCRAHIEREIGTSLALVVNDDKRSIDETNADWISAVFLQYARPENLAKRSDLVANFQFTSNLLLVSTLGAIVVPIYFLIKMEAALFALVTLLCAVLLVAAYWRFSLSSLSRVVTFENLVVFGICIDMKRSSGSKDSNTAKDCELDRQQECVEADGCSGKKIDLAARSVI